MIYKRYSDGRIPTGMSYLKAILSRKENRNDPRLRPYIDGNRSNSPYVNFYRDYLRGGKPAFVPMEDVSTITAIQKIKELGGIPVLAHPSDTGEENILHLVKKGLEGLEVYSPYHNPQEQEGFRVFAEYPRSPDYRRLRFSREKDQAGRGSRPGLWRPLRFGTEVEEGDEREKDERES